MNRRALLASVAALGWLSACQAKVSETQLGELAEWLRQRSGIELVATGTRQVDDGIGPRTVPDIGVRVDESLDADSLRALGDALRGMVGDIPPDERVTAVSWAGVTLPLGDPTPERDAYAIALAAAARAGHGALPTRLREACTMWIGEALISVRCESAMWIQVARELVAEASPLTTGVLAAAPVARAVGHPADEAGLGHKAPAAGDGLVRFDQLDRTIGAASLKVGRTSGARTSRIAVAAAGDLHDGGLAARPYEAGVGISDSLDARGWAQAVRLMDQRGRELALTAKLMGCDLSVRLASLPKGGATRLPEALKDLPKGFGCYQLRIGAQESTAWLQAPGAARDKNAPESALRAARAELARTPDWALSRLVETARLQLGGRTIVLRLDEGLES